MYRGMNREKRILEGEKENGVDSKIPYIWKKKKVAKKSVSEFHLLPFNTCSVI